MRQVLVTGGTGVLGHELVARLGAAGYPVRIMSRRARRPHEWPATEWAQADLATGVGLGEAVAGVQSIVHAATRSGISSLFYHAPAVDVVGTERLLSHTQAAGVGHIVYVSIVGIDQIPIPYYRHKVEAERLVQASGVPWSIVRITQFHTLIDSMLRPAARLPFVLLPMDFRFQPIAPGDAAEAVVAQVGNGPGGLAPNVGGPEVQTLGDLARIWLVQRGLRRRLMHLPLPGRVADAYRRGLNTCPDRRSGTIGWAEWVRRAYPGTGAPRHEEA